MTSKETILADTESSVGSGTCPRMRWASQCPCQMTHRNREQARS